MESPVTELNARFSHPDAVATEWGETRRVLETAELFWITTVRTSGRPHVTPLVAVWVDDALHFSTGPDEQKAVNLRGNSHVILTTGCNDWEGGFDVVVEGEAVQVSDTDCSKDSPRDGRQNGMAGGNTRHATESSTRRPAARPWCSR